MLFRDGATAPVYRSWFYWKSTYNKYPINKEIIMADKIKGAVKWFNNTKGFGFIESSGKEYFVHFSNIISDGFKTLTEGAAVMFKPNQGKKGLEAQEVELI